jgi:hypothetical protein
MMMVEQALPLHVARPIGCTLAVAVAMVSWRYVELPWLRRAGSPTSPALAFQAADPFGSPASASSASANSALTISSRDLRRAWALFSARRAK